MGWIFRAVLSSSFSFLAAVFKRPLLLESLFPCRFQSVFHKDSIFNTECAVLSVFRQKSTCLNVEHWADSFLAQRASCRWKESHTSDFYNAFYHPPPSPLRLMPIHLRLKDGFCPKQFLHRCWYSDLHNHVSPPFAFITIAIIAEDVSAHIIGLFRRLCSMIGQEMFTILQKGRLKNI